ncbi:MAG TPA: hypothetical protein H9721_02185 [Candidatus Limosilactobacillus intestinipullorum]|nr:hypothetical protein [Candidatus Limosilactobacillus intestinipullorum]
MNQKIDANEVIANLQNEIAEKSLQIALLKSQLKEAESKQAKENKTETTDPQVQGDAE